MSTLNVIQPGVMSLVQDSGRYGKHGIGLTTGGPMDRDAFIWANRLCGNEDNSAAIEIMIGGLTLSSDFHGHIAVTGAQMPLKINGNPQPLWQTVAIQPGDRIELGYSTAGARCYLAVAGGIIADPVFGSVATVPREALGGLHTDGSSLANGDQIRCSAHSDITPLRLAEQYRPQLHTKTTLRVIPGYQLEAFEPLQQRRFFSSEYTISDRSDRMGCRVEGPPIQTHMQGMLSEGICLGAIQIPADGQPIILLCDRQTIGGYPKIGSVLSLDLNRLAQLTPGCKVTFQPISMEYAHNLLALHHSRQQHITLQPVEEQST